jgi:hypothetical protein
VEPCLGSPIDFWSRFPPIPCPRPGTPFARNLWPEHIRRFPELARRRPPGCLAGLFLARRHVVCFNDGGLGRARALAVDEMDPGASFADDAFVVLIGSIRIVRQPVLNLYESVRAGEEDCGHFFLIEYHSHAPFSAPVDLTGVAISRSARCRTAALA